MTTRGQLDDRIKRLVPRVNPEVNGHWMCDEGRLSLPATRRAARSSAPSRARTPATGTSRCARRRRPFAPPRRPAARGLVARPRADVRDALRLAGALGAALGSVRAGVRRLERGADDALLLRRDKGANARGAEWILGAGATESAVLGAAARGELDVLVVLGDPLDPDDSVALVGGGVRARARP